MFVCSNSSGNCLFAGFKKNGYVNWIQLTDMHKTNEIQFTLFHKKELSPEMIKTGIEFHFVELPIVLDFLKTCDCVQKEISK